MTRIPNFTRIDQARTGAHRRMTACLTGALVLVAALAAGMSSGTIAQAQDWTVGPPMLAPRHNFALVTLPSGRIMALGGVPDTGGIYDDRTEILDLGLTAWASAATMPSAHRLAEHARLLYTGEVLVAGEHPGHLPYMAHLYNETTGLWTSTANAPSLDRHSAQMTVLTDGRVLYSAGYAGGSGLPTYNSAEIYDPATQLWSPTGSLAQARFGHGAVLLTTGPYAGQVLACGGFNNATLVDTNTCERYDPSAGAWSAAPPMGSPRAQFTFTRLVDGRVLATGGTVIFAPNNRASAEIFDPVAGTWVPLPSMTVPRGRHTATLLPDGRVLVAGGTTVSVFDNATASVEVFDPAAQTWIALDPLATARGNHAAVLLPGGRVLLAGGTSDHFNDKLASTEVYSPDTDGDGVPDANDACPTSDTRATVMVGTCDTGVPNTVLPGGCTMNDQVAACVSGATNHGALVACVTHLANQWKQDGLLSPADKTRLANCAAKQP